MNCERATLSRACRYQVNGRSSVVLALLVTATALLFSASAFAQRTTGTLRGQVLDPAGAVVPNAEVTVTNQETGVSVKVTTTSAGTYALPSLIPGVYKISVEAKGFKSFVKKDVSVIANQDNVADAQVELGIATETIEVTGGSVEVQTTSSSLNNSFDSHSVDLPSGGGTLNGSMLNLAVLAPNVIAQPGGVTGIGGSVGGTRPRDNNFTVDGVDDNNFGGTVGGPIVKNKLFVFGGYEYTYLHGQGAPTAFTAPTASGLATLQANAADSAVSALLNKFPIAPANDDGSVTIHTGGINSATAANVPIDNITIFSPVFQREHDAIVNADYTMGRHQFGARFLINQENFILPVNSTQAIFNQAEPIHN